MFVEDSFGDGVYDDSETIRRLKLLSKAQTAFLKVGSY